MLYVFFSVVFRFSTRKILLLLLGKTNTVFTVTLTMSCYSKSAVISLQDWKSVWLLDVRQGFNLERSWIVSSQQRLQTLIKCWPSVCNVQCVQGAGMNKTGWTPPQAPAGLQAAVLVRREMLTARPMICASKIHHKTHLTLYHLLLPNHF